MTGIRQAFLVLSCLFTMYIHKVMLPQICQKPLEAVYEHGLKSGTSRTFNFGLLSGPPT